MQTELQVDTSIGEEATGLLRGAEEPRLWRSRPKLMVASIFLVAGAIAYATIAVALGKSPRASLRHVDENDFGFIDESGQLTSHLAVSWRVDPGEPGFIKSSKKIFDFAAGDQASVSVSSSTTTIQSSTTEKEFAQKSAVRFGLDVSYCAFNAAVQASYEALGSGTHKQYRETRRTLAKSGRLTSNVPHPASRLNPDVKEFFLNEPVERIHHQYGDFFATEITLGGVMEVSVTTTMFEGETASQASASLSATYDKIFVSAAASVSGSSSRESKSGEHTYHYEAKTQGGRSTIWLGVAKENVQEIQKEWAQSVTESNEHPIDFRLRPLWELLEDPGMDSAKAGALKKYMLDKWQSTTLPDYAAEPKEEAYVEGTITNAEYPNTEYSSDAEVQAACNANVACKGYWKQTLSGKYFMLTSGSRKWERGVPNDSVESVKVKKEAQAYSEGTITNAEYPNMEYYSDAEVQAACSADGACKGYWKQAISGKYFMLTSGSRKWEQGVPNDTVESVKVKNEAQAR